MKHLYTLFLFFCFSFCLAQTGYHLKRYSHFEGTRGNSETELILSLPELEIVQLENHLNTTSGFGWTFNYFGNVLVVEQLDVLADGTKQLVLRREDGKDFFSNRSTIKAIIKPIAAQQLVATNNPE